MANYKKGQELGIHGGVKRMHKWTNGGIFSFGSFFLKPLIELC